MDRNGFHCFLRIFFNTRNAEGYSNAVSQFGKITEKFGKTLKNMSNLLYNRAIACPISRTIIFLIWMLLDVK